MSERKSEENRNSSLHTIIQSICAIASVVVAISALGVAIQANKLSQMAYNHSTISYNPIIEIEKNDSFINIVNNDSDIFDIYNITIDGVKSYKYGDNDLKLTMFHCDYDQGDNNINLNNLEINLNKGFQSSYKILSEEDTKKFNDTVEENIEMLNSSNVVLSYQEDIYYINISYSNKYDYESKTICLECRVNEDGTFESKVPWSNIKDIYPYRELDGYFNLINFEHRLGYGWNNVTKWLEENKKHDINNE